jgi:plasmid stabilization system protein ParE
MNLRFTVAAQAEFEAAIDHYELERPGLGDTFVAAFDETIERIRLNPDAWTIVSEGARRCLFKRFPYGVFYRVDGDVLIIVAVLHLHRHPDSWRGRCS